MLFWEKIDSGNDSIAGGGSHGKLGQGDTLPRLRPTRVRCALSWSRIFPVTKKWKTFVVSDTDAYVSDTAESVPNTDTCQL